MIYRCALKVDDKQSFEHVKTKWLPELREHADPHISIMYSHPYTLLHPSVVCLLKRYGCRLIGAKADLLAPTRVISSNQGELLAEQVGMLFSEVCTFNQSGIVENAFKSLTSQISQYQRMTRRAPLY